MVTLREFNHDDGDACLRLFLDTIRRVNCRDYNPRQIAAWASDEIDRSAWMRRFDNRVAFVAEQSGSVKGFADMTEEGFLDRLFVSANAQRQGIATELLGAAINKATDLGLPMITTEASITARPFFLAQRFAQIREQSVECRGEMLKNFLMRRPIGVAVDNAANLDQQDRLKNREIS